MWRSVLGGKAAGIVGATLVFALVSPTKPPKIRTLPFRPEPTLLGGKAAGIVGATLVVALVSLYRRWPSSVLKGELRPSVRAMRVFGQVRPDFSPIIHESSQNLDNGLLTLLQLLHVRP